MLKLFKSKAFIFSICIIITILNTTVLANNFDFSIYNGETKLQLTNSPYIKDDEIYLPLREILQQFGAYDIIWNDGNIQIEYTNTMEYGFDNCCTFSIGSSELRFFPSNDAIHLRSAPDLVNGITYVPTDFFYNLITKGGICDIQIYYNRSNKIEDYINDGEENEIFIGTGLENDNFDSNNKKRIITNHDNQVIGIVSVENQKPEIIQQKLSTTATKIHVYSFNDIQNAGISVIDKNRKKYNVNTGVFVHSNGKIVAYIPAIDIVNMPIIEFREESEYDLTFNLY